MYGDMVTRALLTNVLWDLARTVKRNGITEVQNIIIDDTLFVDPPSASGERPYQAGLSATSLNHNCYAVHIAAGPSGLPASVTLTEGAPYTLSNRVVSKKGGGSNIRVSQSLMSNSFNPNQVFQKSNGALVLSDREMSLVVKGSIGIKKRLETRYFTVPFPPSYMANVLAHHLATLGVAVKGELRVEETPAAAKSLFVYQSPSLVEIVTDLNHYSNNFIAGQLLYALGQDEKGYFRQELGLERLNEYLEALGFSPSSFAILDASGLNRGNRLSVEQLVAVLSDAYRDFSIAPNLVSSLSRFEHTGTLEKRSAVGERLKASALKFELPSLLRRGAGVWGKTGTLDGVSSLAGYLELKSGERVAFAILVAGVSKDTATRIEDTIVEKLVSG